MKVEFTVQESTDAKVRRCQLEVFSDDIVAISAMPLSLIVDRMHGSLVCLAARKAKSGIESTHIRPLIAADGEPIPIVAKTATLQGLLEAITEDEVSSDW